MAKKKFKKKKPEGQPNEPIVVKRKIVKNATFYPSFGKQQWFLSSSFILVAFLMYFMAISFGYVLDDLIVITGNSFTQKGFSGMWEILSTESFQGYFGEQKDLVQGARYRPLSILTFAVEYAIFGMKPGISHAVNIFLYSLVGIALYYFLNLLFTKKKSHKVFNIAFISSLIYMVHPLHSEAVANIKGRDEILTFFLVLLSSICVLKWEQWKHYKWAFGSSVLFFLALLAKENAITFLAVIPVTFWIFRSVSVKQILIYTSPLIVATIAYLTIRYSVIGYFLNSGKAITDIMNNPFLNMSLGEKYATISFTLWKYLQLSFFPHPLAHDYYPYAIPILNWADIRAYGSILVYAILGMISLYGFVKKSKWVYGLLFYLITLTIISNVFVNVGTFMNERFLFISSAGICMMMGWGFVRLFEQEGKYFKYGALAMVSIIIVGYAGKTFSRVPAWENAFTLNQSAVKVNPGSARANSFMATSLYNSWKDQPNSDEKKQAMEVAFFHADKAAKMIPNYRNAQLMKAGAATELFKINSDLNALLKVFAEIISFRPDVDFVPKYLEYLNGKITDGRMADWYYETTYRRLLLTQKSRLAPQYLQLAYNHAPNDRRIIQALAEAYQATGQASKAEEYFNKLQSQ